MMTINYTTPPEAGDLINVLDKILANYLAMEGHHATLIKSKDLTTAQNLVIYMRYMHDTLSKMAMYSEMNDDDLQVIKHASNNHPTPA